MKKFLILLFCTVWINGVCMDSVNAYTEWLQLAQYLPVNPVVSEQIYTGAQALQTVKNIYDIQEQKKQNLPQDKPVFFEEQAKYKILDVVDGDTVAISIQDMPANLNNFKLRVLGIDTPEKNYLAKCQKERDLGYKATDFTKYAINSAKHVNVELIQHDKYGGRIDGNIYLDGRSLADLLIAQGLAVRYDGGTKTHDWCI